MLAQALSGATQRSTVVTMSESTTNTPDQTPEPAATPAEPAATDTTVLPVVVSPTAAPATATPMWPSPVPAELASPAPLSSAAALPVAPAGVQTSSSAIVALVLSVASWAVCPIVLAIIALVFASKADKEIARSGGALEGGGMITAAKIVAWVNIGVFIAVCVILVCVVIIALVAGGLSQVSPAGQV